MTWSRGVGAWLGRRRVRLALPVVALVVAVTAIAVIALTGGGPAAPDTLKATGPAAGEVTGDPTPPAALAPSEFAAPPDSATTPVVITAAPMPSPTATERALSSAMLLSTSSINAVFGHGTMPVVQRGSFEQAGQPNNYGPQGSCFNRSEGGDANAPGVNDRWFRPIVDRTWTWPGPVWVAETLHRAADPAAARVLLRRCAAWTEPAPGGGAAGESSLAWSDIGDGQAFTRRAGYAAFTTYHAGAVVGRDVVELTWRQTGSVTSAGTIDGVLRAAVAWRRGDEPDATTAAPAPREPAAVTVLLELDQIWPLYDGADRVLDWTGDAVAADEGFRCTSENGSTETTIGAVGPEVTREWVAGDDDDPAVDFSLTVSRAVAPDEQTAAQQFSECRGPHGSGDTGAGFGDESFVVSTSGIDESPALVFVRVGRVYYLIATALQGSQLTDVVTHVLAAEQQES